MARARGRARRPPAHVGSRLRVQRQPAIGRRAFEQVRGEHWAPPLVACSRTLRNGERGAVGPKRGAGPGIVPFGEPRGPLAPHTRGAPGVEPARPIRWVSGTLARARRSHPHRGERLGASGPLDVGPARVMVNGQGAPVYVPDGPARFDERWGKRHSRDWRAGPTAPHGTARGRASTSSRATPRAAPPHAGGRSGGRTGARRACRRVQGLCGARRSHPHRGERLGGSGPLDVAPRGWWTEFRRLQKPSTAPHASTGMGRAAPSGVTTSPLRGALRSIPSRPAERRTPDVPLGPAKTPGRPRRRRRRMPKRTWSPPRGAAEDIGLPGEDAGHRRPRWPRERSHAGGRLANVGSRVGDPQTEPPGMTDDRPSMGKRCLRPFHGRSSGRRDSRPRS